MKVVIALYVNQTKAFNAVRTLVDNGFPEKDISVVAHAAAGEYGRYVEDPTFQDIAEREPGEDDDGTKGARIGTALGALTGLLIGLGAVTIPGIGPAIAAGSLVTAVLATGAGGIIGGMVGALVDAGIPSNEAEAYAEGVRRGGTLVVVQAPDEQARQAAKLLFQHGPVDIEELTARWRKEGWTGFDEEATPYDRDAVLREQERVVDARVEEVEVEDEDLVARGRTRIYPNE